MKWIVFFVVLLGIAASASAQELAGRVVDAADGRPLAGAILLAADSTGRQAGYTTSAADGAFRLRPRQGMRAAWIDVSMMGYRAQRFNAARLPQEIRLAASAVEIREVEIRAPRLSLRGDTVSYNVASFTEAQDRTIADVLRKMPGIEIEKTGEIRYNGEAINKFYIEGMDMLDGRYSLATNNIAPQDVASVEVMENHQPIKALRDVLYSDRAALNFRLKKQARAHWTGTLRGAGGWSPDEVLGSGSAFAMRIATRSQSMLNLKDDNTGEDPTADLRQLSVEEMLNGADNRYEAPAWFSTGLSEAPLDDRRTRLNHSVMASADYLRKLTEDYQLSGHIACGYDRLTSDYASRIVRYLSDGELTEELAEQARLTDRQLAAQVKLLANTERFYLMDRLSADLAWSDFDARTTGSYPNRQQTVAPTHRVENDLNYIRRTGRRTFTVTSNLLWLTQPQQLDVVREGSAQWQTLDVDLLRMNHNVAWGLEAGRRWVFQFKGGVAALYRRLDAALSGLGVETSAPLAADTHFGYGSLYLRPTATYRTQRLRLMLALPVDWRCYRYTDGSSSPLLWSANLSARWTPSACWTLSASGAAGEQGADDSSIYPAALLRDYRTLASGAASPVSTPMRMLAAGANYKNPLSGIFAHLFLQRSWYDLPWLATQDFEGDYIVSGQLREANRMASWSLASGVSTNIDALYGQAGVDLTWSDTQMEISQQGVRMPYRSGVLTLSPRVNLRAAGWLNVEYTFNYRYTQLRIESAAPTDRHAFDQRLQLNFTPAPNLVLQLTGEHYRTQLSDTRSKHLVLLDASVRWKVGQRWELWAAATNLLNETEYAYTLFDGLSSSTCRYAIRPCNLLLGASWRF